MHVVLWGLPSGLAANCEKRKRLYVDWFARECVVRNNVHNRMRCEEVCAGHQDVNAGHPLPG